MTTDADLPALPEPDGYFCEVDSYFGVHRQFDLMPYNGVRPQRTVGYFTADTVRAAIAADRERAIDMVLYCPNCGMQHIDAPESDEDYRAKHLAHGGFDDQWTNPPHRTHLCHGCGCKWRPADVPTNGVAEIKTKGKADSWPVNADEISAQRARPVVPVETYPEPPENFQEGQWWLQELDNAAQDVPADLKRAVATVRHLMRSAHKAAGERAGSVDARVVEDAERYRWLRDVSVPPHNFYLSVPVEFAGVKYTPQEVDAAIDAARSKP